MSLTSGTLIANALIRKGHRVLLLDAYIGDPEAGSKQTKDLFRDCEYEVPRIQEQIPDLERLKRQLGNPRTYLGPNVLRLCEAADLVYLGLHGGMGENGQIQAVLDSYGIRYTGSGYVGSLLAMHKGLTKQMFKMNGIPTPEGICLTHEGWTGEMLEPIRFPCVVKPASCGSSVGVSMIDTPEELKEAVEEAFRWCDEIIIEDRIIGRELTMAVLNGDVLPPVEIIPKTGFYDYKNKYQTGQTEEICPAQVNDTVLRSLKDISLRAFRVLHLKDYARFDYILDERDRLWCLEANTLPGMTPTSLLPRMAACRGVSYDDLCDLIVHMSMPKKEPCPE